MGNLETIIGAKLCHAVTLSRLNISYVDGTPVVQKVPKLVPKLFFPVPGTVALVLNTDIGQGSGSRYTFEKHSFNQQHVRLNFAKAFCGAFSKNHN